MRDQVFGQVWLSRERLLTGIAGVGFIWGVHHNMACKEGGIRKGFIAYVTGKWLFTWVNPQVCLQVSGLWKHFVTNRAGKRSFLCRMTQFHMVRQFRKESECLTANFTSKCVISCYCCCWTGCSCGGDNSSCRLVGIHCRSGHCSCTAKHLATYFACKCM